MNSATTRGDSSPTQHQLLTKGRKFHDLMYEWRSQILENGDVFVSAYMIEPFPPMIDRTPLDI